ncbi:MAG: amino acid permease [bacterium]|jgi:APA family basic amino acid/polyamine antiporter
MSYKLSFLSCLGIVVGTIIGSGIFVVPSIMINILPSPQLILLVWVLAAIVSIIGGLVIAGMGNVFPEAKNLLDYYRLLFPPWISIAFNLASNWIINPCGTVAIAFVFAEYTGYFIALDPSEIKLTAIALLFMMTLMDSINMKIADRFQMLFTAIKIAAIIVLVTLLIMPGKGSINNFTSAPIMSNWNMIKIIGTFVAACTGALNAFDGWYMVSHLTAEVKGGSKTVGRAIIVGLLICMVLYLMTTLAYHFVLTPVEVGSSKLVAVTALQKVSFGWAPGLIAVMILISTGSAVNANMIASSRLIASSAENRMLPKYFSKKNKKNIPLRAFWLIFFFETILVLTGSYELFLDVSLFAVWLFVTILTAGFLKEYINRKIKTPNINKIAMIAACLLLIVFGIVYLGNFFLTN